MLRFFRQIRQRLLTDNKFSKYLLYAVGEILLVVIGILIALQIDNWNEERKERSLYQQYLVRLKADFENLYNTTERQGWWGGELLNLAEYQAGFLSGKLDSLDTLKLAISIEFTGSINRYKIDLPTSSELSSTGRLTIIENDTLKNTLYEWIERSAYRESENAEWHQWIYKYRGLVRNILTKDDKINIDFSWMNSYPGDKRRWESFKLATPGHKITNGLSDIPELPGLLNDIIVARMITKGYLNNEKKSASDAIELIEREIHRLEK